MKRLPGRIVLAVIILSCGFVLQIGSNSSGSAEARTKTEAGKRIEKTTWVPTERELRIAATLLAP